MGFLDNAKNKISTSFGEEIVGQVSFEEKKAAPEEKGPKAPRQKRERPKRERPQKRVIVEEPEEQEEEIKASKGARSKKRFGKNETEEKEHKERQKREKPTRNRSEDIIDEDVDEELDDTAEDDLPSIEFIMDNEPQESETADDNLYASSAFAVEDDSIDEFFSKKQEEYDAEMAERYEGVPDLQVRDKQIQDVLEVLDIPPTFDIETDVFLPEDLENVVFDLQTPIGFEQGQVDLFVRQTRNSIKRYVELLKLRNEHVAKLATVVDKLQVDANNLRYESEIANGINVMPSHSSDDLESKYNEARMEIGKLREELSNMRFGGALTAQERNRYNDLQDQLSIVRRENEDLKEENYTLKNQAAILQEELDEALEGNSSHNNAVNDTYMPPIAVDEEEEEAALPQEIEGYTPGAVEQMHSHTTAPSAESAFFVDKEEDGAGIEALKDHSEKDLNGVPVFSEYEEEEDEIDKMMRDWNK